MAYENHWTKNGLYRKFSGTITGKEIFESNTQLHGDARFDDLEYIVNDFTAIDGYEYAEFDINLIALSDKVSKLVARKVKIALVINIPELFDLVDMYLREIGEAEFDCRVFHSTDEAREWIEG